MSGRTDWRAVVERAAEIVAGYAGSSPERCERHAATTSSAPSACGSSAKTMGAGRSWR